jgi:hypothetical protein
VGLPHFNSFYEKGIRYMKKLVFIVLLSLLIVPTLVFAQADWDLSQEVLVESLGIRFNVPDGWVSQESGVTTYVAETQEDLDVLGDGDADTKATGFAVAVSGFPLEALELTDATLEEIAETITSQSSVEVGESGEVTVNLRPAYYVFGTSATDGTTSYLALWKQDGNLIILGLLLPDENTSDDIAFAFGRILGSVRTIVSEDFTASDERYEVTDLGYSLYYPAEWTTADTAELAGASGAIFAENADDIGAELAAGTVITILQIPGSIEELELSEDSEVEDYVAAFAGLLGIENVVSQGEFVINGEWGVGFTGNSSASGRPGLGIVTYSEEAEAFNVYIVASADDETLAEYIPVFQIMLWSIEPIE